MTKEEVLLIQVLYYKKRSILKIVQSKLLIDLTFSRIDKRLTRLRVNRGRWCLSGNQESK